MMKNNLNVRNYTIVAIICAFTIVFINACKQEQYTLSTTDDVNITGYLDKYPDQFSLMRQVINRSGTAGYLGAYGKYTLFTPNNEAVTAWLKSKNKTSVDQISPEDCKDLVKYHLLPDTIATNRFTDGKLPQITLYGQYLQTGVSNSGGSSSFTVNKLAKIVTSNVRLGNGIVHVLDQVLTPATLTTAAMIEKSGRYTYFTQALKETGFYDSLNVASAAQTDTTRRFQTVILESDSALKAAGFATYADFKNKLSKTGNPRNHADSLWLHVAYHLSPGPTYTPDIISSSAIYTLAPKEVVTTKFVGQKILLNDDEFNGVIEPGVEVNRTFSDVTTSNGVIHEAKSYYRIKVRFQTPVYFDLGDQPELRANPKWRGAVASTIDLIANGASLLSGYIANRYTGQLPTYSFSPTFGGTRQYANGDLFVISMGTSNTARAQWVEFKTPMLVKGKYKVWICYAQNGNAPVTQVGVDIGRPGEQLLPNLVDLRQYLGASGVTSATSALPSADPLMLTNGFKRYMGTNIETSGTVKGGMIVTGSNWDTMVGRLAGTADIQTTDRHWIRLTCVGGATAQNNVTIDMIHFIPLDVDQNYPRFSQVQGVTFKRP